LVSRAGVLTKFKSSDSRFSDATNYAFFLDELRFRIQDFVSLNLHLGTSCILYLVVLVLGSRVHHLVLRIADYALRITTQNRVINEMRLLFPSSSLLRKA
jgi:hypothetical protein